MKITILVLNHFLFQFPRGLQFYHVLGSEFSGHNTNVNTVTKNYSLIRFAVVSLIN